MMEIKAVQMNSEIYSCLICDDICGFSALEEGLQVIFHICFNCQSLYEVGLLPVKSFDKLKLVTENSDL